MSELPDNAVWRAVELHEVEVPIREYLGYSMLGHKCSRYLWFYFRWMYKVFLTPRQIRLFSRGDQEEPILVRDLECAGVQCFDTLENQVELIGPMGHVKGHPDGRCINVPGAEKTEHLLEIKTANEKRYNEIVRFGVEKSNPEYWVQVNCYMGKLKLTRCLFCVTNKNTDHRHYERIHYHKDVFEQAEERALDIISSPVPPPRISERPEWYECKWCDAYNLCHRGEAYQRNCRTCINAKIKDQGAWNCGLHESAGPIPVEFQRTGCPDMYRPFL